MHPSPTPSARRRPRCGSRLCARQHAIASVEQRVTTISTSMAKLELARSRTPVSPSRSSRLQPRPQLPDERPRGPCRSSGRHLHVEEPVLRRTPMSTPSTSRTSEFVTPATAMPGQGRHPCGLLDRRGVLWPGLLPSEKPASPDGEQRSAHRTSADPRAFYEPGGWPAAGAGLHLPWHRGHWPVGPSGCPRVVWPLFIVSWSPDRRRWSGCRPPRERAAGGRPPRPSPHRCAGPGRRTSPRAAPARRAAPPPWGRGAPGRGGNEVENRRRAICWSAAAGADTAQLIRAPRPAGEHAALLAAAGRQRPRRRHETHRHHQLTHAVLRNRWRRSAPRKRAAASRHLSVIAASATVEHEKRVPVPEMQVEEIEHMAEPHPIQNVAGRSAQHGAQRARIGPRRLPRLIQ